jgi:DNA mismatch endonuclease (patch repair protein)
MTDTVSPTDRSRMMAGIRGKDTQPELALRRALFARGYRYRLHDRSLPGRPDLVFSKWDAVIFVHGCFWHRHKGCRFATKPATRPEFWEAKFAGNVERDNRQMAALRASGWRVRVVWECDVRRDLGAEVDLAVTWLAQPATRLSGKKPPKTKRR